MTTRLVPHHNLQLKCQLGIISIYFYGKWQSTFCMIYLHHCSKLSTQIHPGTLLGYNKVMRSDWTGIEYGQIFTETATYSFDFPKTPWTTPPPYLVRVQYRGGGLTRCFWKKKRKFFRFVK